MQRRVQVWGRLLGAGLLVSAAGCSGGGGQGLDGERPFRPGDLGSAKTGLLRAQSCDDLLTKIQNDAIAKLDLTVAQYKREAASGPGTTPRPGGWTQDSGAFTPNDPLPVAPPRAGSDGLNGGGTAGGSGSSGGGGSVVDESAGEAPVGSSDTNTQVQGVDEADFVKVVDSGRGMFILHGNTLRRLKTFPAAELALEEASLTVEGQPSELFVTAEGRAVIFSSVYGYDTGKDPYYGDSGGWGGADICGPTHCGGYYGATRTKITIADVSGPTFTTLRELYYEGNYVSSRRYDDVVRVVLQAQTSYGNLYTPSISYADSFGRPYDNEQLADQLDQWRDRVATDVRSTELADWLPIVQEAEDGELVDVPPTCNSYFVPQPGLSDHGLTHVLSLDVSQSDGAVGGVTVMGQTSTVYSNADRMVLAQPDYRWSSRADFGFIDEQRTSLHVFELAAADTGYLASGWVRGHLPHHNPQFGLDVAADHTLRIVATGQVRANPDATPESPEFWERSVENHLYTLRQSGQELTVVGTSENLGHWDIGETVHSARFVGDRAYVVTFLQTDPLIALDVSNAEAPTVLGEIEIPGFSQYIHPLDQNHLITFGVSESRGQQLQLFDVSDPSREIPAPKVLDLGVGGWSELANNHKAFTFYAPQNLIALPLSGYSIDASGNYKDTAGLQVIRVDAEQGFTALGTIDHTPQYEVQGCYVCYDFGECYNQCGHNVQMRRGHFVESADTTYVYGISYAAVSVSDLASLAQPIQTVVLPQVTADNGAWYGTNGGAQDGGAPVADAGIAPPPPMSTDPGMADDPGTVEPDEQDGGAADSVEQL